MFVASLALLMIKTRQAVVVVSSQRVDPSALALGSLELGSTFKILPSDEVYRTAATAILPIALPTLLHYLLVYLPRRRDGSPTT